MAGYPATHLAMARFEGLRGEERRRNSRKVHKDDEAVGMQESSDKHIHMYQHVFH